MRGRYPATQALNTQEVTSATHTPGRRKPTGGSELSHGLFLVHAHGQAPATLAPAVLQHLAATFGAVALAKTVRAKPARVRWLKRSLHDRRVLRAGSEPGAPGAGGGESATLRLLSQVPERGTLNGCHTPLGLAEAALAEAGSAVVARPGCHARQDPSRFLGRHRLHLLHDQEQAYEAGQDGAQKVRPSRAPARGIQGTEDATAQQVARGPGSPAPSGEAAVSLRRGS